ncbi:MAG: CBS domain-containing protein, partial [Gammaproteobacteria bacterium]
HEDDEYGIVLLSDIAKKVLARNKAPERVNVYEIMSKPVISVDPDMDIRYCTRMFENFGLGRVPVVEGKKVVGIVGYTDIVLSGVRDRLLG